jgi:hypothetical protein
VVLLDVVESAVMVSVTIAVEEEEEEEALVEGSA